MNSIQSNESHQDVSRNTARIHNPDTGLLREFNLLIIDRR